MLIQYTCVRETYCFEKADKGEISFWGKKLISDKHWYWLWDSDRGDLEGVTGVIWREWHGWFGGSDRGDLEGVTGVIWKDWQGYLEGVTWMISLIWIESHGLFGERDMSDLERVTVMIWRTDRDDLKEGTGFNWSEQGWFEESDRDDLEELTEMIWRESRCCLWVSGRDNLKEVMEMLGGNDRILCMGVLRMIWRM